MGVGCSLGCSVPASSSGDALHGTLLLTITFQAVQHNYHCKASTCERGRGYSPHFLKKSLSNEMPKGRFLKLQNSYSEFSSPHNIFQNPHKFHKQVLVHQCNDNDICNNKMQMLCYNFVWQTFQKLDIGCYCEIVILLSLPVTQLGYSYQL